VQKDDGIGDKWFQVIPGSAVFIVDLFEGERFRAEGFENFVVLFDFQFELAFESFGIDQIDHPQTRSSCFVTISGADAAFGGANFVFAFENFALGVELAVIGKNEMGRFAQVKIAVDFDPEFAETFDLTDEADRIDDDSITNHTNLFLAQNARGDEMEDVFLAADVNGMAGIVAALCADDDVRFFGEHVDNFAFSLIAPLGTHQNCICHSIK